MKRVSSLVAMPILILATLSNAATADEPISVGERFEADNRPVGLSGDGWEFFPSLTFASGYDSNIQLSSTAPDESAELSLGGGIRASTRNGIFAFDAAAFLGNTWYPSSPEQNYVKANTTAAASADINQNVRLRASIGFTQDAEAARNNGIVVNNVFESYRTRPIVQRTPVEAGVAYNIGSVTADASARFENISVDPLRTVSGLRVDQSFRNGWEDDFTLRAEYAYVPQLTLLAEASYSPRRYDISAADNDVTRALLGGKFELSRLLLGEVRVGAARQSFQNGVEVSGLVYGAKLRWFPYEELSLVLDAERDFGAEIEQTAGTSNAFSAPHDDVKLRAEFEAEQATMIFAQAGYQDEKRDRTNRNEDTWSLSTGAVYALTKELRLRAEYGYLRGNSNFAGNFDQSRVTLGLTAAY